MSNIKKSSIEVRVGNVGIGGNNPIRIQSMTNTDTADIENSYKQICDLHSKGSEIVRLTVNNEKSAEAIPYIRERLDKDGISVPLVGCFHYNGHTLLKNYPDCAEALDKYRINPGNVGFGNKRDKNFESIIEMAILYDKPIRIGVNWGSLDSEIVTRMMDDNSKLTSPLSSNEILKNAIIESTLQSSKFAQEIGLPNNKIILSAKTSDVSNLIDIYRRLSEQTDCPLHLGLTEAGMGNVASTATSIALGILLHEGIGHTIRASLTPNPNSNDRTEEVELCKNILQSLGLRSFKPRIIACPGCGRTSSTYFQTLALKIENYIEEQMPIWKEKYFGVENMHIAVMGCIVNGPGESKHADIGISLPGTGENPVAPVFIDNQKAHTLRGENIYEEFIQILQDYIERRFA